MGKAAAVAAAAAVAGITLLAGCGGPSQQDQINQSIRNLEATGTTFTTDPPEPPGANQFLADLRGDGNLADGNGQPLFTDAQLLQTGEEACSTQVPMTEDGATQLRQAGTPLGSTANEGYEDVIGFAITDLCPPGGLGAAG